MLREPLLMKVDIDGTVVRRKAEPHYLYNERGQLVATRMRPIVQPGEVLVDRLGTFPQIISVLA